MRVPFPYVPRISPIWLLPPASGMVRQAPGGNHFTGKRNRMSTIPSRDKLLWAEQAFMGKPAKGLPDVRAGASCFARTGKAAFRNDA